MQKEICLNVKVLFIPLILICFFILLPSFLYAEKWEIAYLDGILEYKQNKSWIEVDIGDKIPENAILKVGDDTIAEFTKKGATITISRQGTYSFPDLIKNSGKVSSWQIGALLEQQFNSIFGKDSPDNRATVMGVRGDIEEEDSGIEWAEEEAEAKTGAEAKTDNKVDEDKLLTKGKELIINENYEEAIKIFKNACLKAHGNKKQQYLFYTGLLYSMLGQDAHALKYLNRVKTDVNTLYFSDLILLKGRLLMESLSFKEALDIFDVYLENLPKGENAQSIYFLSAVCYAELDAGQKAMGRLKKAVSINKSSDIGKEAAEWMNRIE